jgi:hypothetical protein
MNHHERLRYAEIKTRARRYYEDVILTAKDYNFLLELINSHEARTIMREEKHSDNNQMRFLLQRSDES